MYPDILSNAQKEQLSFLQKFKREFILVGGTALALQIGHRRSIDFDLFKTKPFSKKKILETIHHSNFKYQKLFEDYDGVHYLINDVKYTFFYYPFSIRPSTTFEGNIKMPDLITLAAMKFYAMGRRAKWKDYVDIYILLKNHFTIGQVSIKATGIFEGAYSEKLFRQQLSYFEGIDYSEPIEWVTEPIGEKEIRDGLLEMSLDF